MRRERGSLDGPTVESDEQARPLTLTSTASDIFRVPRSPLRLTRPHSADAAGPQLQADRLTDDPHAVRGGIVVLPPIQGFRLEERTAQARPSAAPDTWAGAGGHSANGGVGLIAARRRMTIMSTDSRHPHGTRDAYRKSVALNFASSGAETSDTGEKDELDNPQQPRSRHVRCSKGQVVTYGGSSSQCKVSAGSDFADELLEVRTSAGKGDPVGEVPLPVLQAPGPPSPAARFPPWKLYILQWINHRYFFKALVVCTLYIIFEDDVKRAAMPPAADLALEVVATLITLFFIIDMVLGSLARPGYFLGFYFWVDAIATASLMFEIPAVKTSVLRIGSSGDTLSLSTEGQFITEVGTLIFIFGKTARVAKIFRLMQLLRLFKLYQQFEARRTLRRALEEAGQGTMQEQALTLMEMELQAERQETRVGQRLEELTIRRVVVGVLLMILVLPGLDPMYGLWGRYQGVDRGGLRMLHDMAVSGGGNGTAAFDMALKAFYDTASYTLGTQTTSQIYYLTIANYTLIPYPDNEPRRYEELYSMEYVSAVPPGCGTIAVPCTAWYVTLALYDWHWISQMTAILNIMRSIFLLLLFTLGAYFLNHDTRLLVLRPIERMVQKLQDMADNPLRALGSRDEQAGSLCTRLGSRAGPRNHASTVASRTGLSARLAAAWRSATTHVSGLFTRVVDYFWDGLPDNGPETPNGTKKAETTYETLILEDSLQKIGALLAIGFGDAGAEIIAENIKNRGDLNPLVPGRKTVAVFGFCDIRQFTDTTEVLQEDVMEFVNSIAKIVHTCVAVHGGAANKNIGDAFLLVWKFPQEFSTEDIRSMGRDSIFRPASVAPRPPSSAWAMEELGTRESPKGFDCAPAALCEGIEEANEEEEEEDDAGPGLMAACSPASAAAAAALSSSPTTTLVGPLGPVSRLSAWERATSRNDSSKDTPDQATEDFHRSRTHDAVELMAAAAASPSPTKPPSHSALLSTAASHVSKQQQAPHRSVSLAPLGSLQLPSQQAYPSGAKMHPLEQGTLQPQHNASHQRPSPLGPQSGTNALLGTPSERGTTPVPAAGKGLGHILSTISRRVVDSVSSATASVSGRAAGESLWGNSKVVPVAGSGTEGHRAAMGPRGVVTFGPKAARISSVTSNDSGPGGLDSEGCAANGSAGSSGIGTIAAGADGWGGSLHKSTLLRAGSSHGGDTNAMRSLRALTQQRTLPGSRQPMSAPEKAEVVRLVADNALAAFIVIQAALKRSARLHRFCQRADLNARMPNFRVGMGFGLHVGWAIEGAIGSEFKIDASYLSPNVNMASRLEAATKQFGVPLLLSGDFVDCLSPRVQQRVRQIDCVIVKGSDRPVKLYTYDICLDHIAEPNLLAGHGATEEVDEAAQADMLWTEYNDEWSENPDLNATWGITAGFKAKFDEGFQAYISGSWQEARYALEGCLDMRRDGLGNVLQDVPTRVLLDHMAKSNYQAPGSWMGFRELTEK